jgi:membrane protease YdiL (CAAX protease family)
MPMNRKTLLLITVITEGGLLLVGLVLMSFAHIAFLPTFKPTPKATLFALLLCLPMFVGLYLSMRSKWTPIVQLKTELEEKVLPIFSNCKIIDLAVIAFFAGLGEELFFRGWMQSVLINKSGVWVGILITSLVFGLLHYLSTTYAIYAFITGVYLGVIYYVSGNLYIVLAIHAVYDFVALVYLVRKGGEKGVEIQVAG